MRRLIERKGQNTLEYVIILTALVVAFIAGTTAVKNALYSKEGDGASGLIGEAADRIPAWTSELPGAKE